MLTFEGEIVMSPGVFKIIMLRKYNIRASLSTIRICIKTLDGFLRYGVFPKRFIWIFLLYLYSIIWGFDEIQDIGRAEIHTIRLVFCLLLEGATYSVVPGFE